MSRYTRDYGQASSWYPKGWAPSKNTYSGWSKTATRGYYSHEWDEDASRRSTQTWVVQPETWADAEVEIVDEPDKNQGKAVTNEAERRMPRCDYWENSIDCQTVEKEATTPPTRKHRRE